MQLKERKTQNTLAFAGMLVICLLGLFDLLFRNRIFILSRIAGQEFATPIAMCFFVFCYAMVVALEYADTERSLSDERRQVESLSVSNAALDRISRMRSDIIATISHESRTPLAVLASYAGLVSMELKAKGVDEQIAADLDTVAFEAKRVANLIDGMRKLSQQNEVKAERSVLDIGDIIRQTARLYEPIIERGSISATVKTENGEVSVAITDTGTGIGPELLPRVFERSVVGEKGGTGIGLAICKEVIESHGGRITIASEPGQGTTVTFTLPEYTDGDGERHAG
jgi:signal transduction histidine kinase